MGLTRLGDREAETPFGFATHVHSERTGRVLADAELSYVGMTTDLWRLEVGLASSAFDDLESAGAWAGPFSIRTRPGMQKAPHYLYHVRVEISDVLADGVNDGIGDIYTVIVAV